LALGVGKPNLVPADAADLEKAFFDAVCGEG
jgi:hypothetical protein